MLRRRAALQAIQRILEASALEDLFAVPEEEAAFLYHLLVETAKARRSRYFSEVCRVARRRGLTPDYVVDRALVLLASIAERRRHDLYRILGLPALASAEAVHVRWRELARQHHPDAGGTDPALFRRLREAYEVLRDPERRADYERFWLRTIGPFERIAEVLDNEEAELRAAAEEASAQAGGDGRKPSPYARGGVAGFLRQFLGLGPGGPAPAARGAALAGQGARGGSPHNGASRPPVAPPASAPSELAASRPEGGPLTQVAARAEALASAFGSVDRRLVAAGAGGIRGVEELRWRLAGALSALPSEEVAGLLGQVEEAVERLVSLVESLHRLQALKRGLGSPH